MQRYRWPGYEIQLLGELQRQQKNAQFCDTLLQTEGISVPTHSCILTALSPYLSQKLSASPSPPSGQKRQFQLQLHAVKAQTLLKLVGLLYSGEVEVKGSTEQNDLLSTAHQFGIKHLIEEHKDRGIKEGEPQKKSFGSCTEKNEDKGRDGDESRKMQDAQIQTEMAGSRATDSPIEKRSLISKGTQTVKAGRKRAGSSFTHSSQTKPPTFNGARSYGESTLDRSSDSVTNPTSTSAWSSNKMSFPSSLNNDSNSSTSQQDHSYWQSAEFGDRIGTRLKIEKTNARTSDRRENTEQPSHTNRDEIIEKKKRNSTESKLAHANVGKKSLAKVRMMETTQVSIKVKLRRRTNREVWEVVSIQDTDETLSVLTSLKQNGSDHGRPQTDLTHCEPPPSSSVQPGPIHKPETPILQPPATNSPEPPPQPNTTSDSQLLWIDCFTPSQNDGPVEESDEQIEKLLEEIMMGLNILPNLERDYKNSHDLQPSHDGAICQFPVTENEEVQSQMHAAVSAVGCVCYQDFGTQVDHCSTHTAQNQPSCSSLSSVQSDAVFIQQQQQQHFPQCHSSVTSVLKTDGTSHQDMPLSKRQNCPYPEASRTRSVIPSAPYSSGQKRPYPACQEPSSQDDQNSLLYLTNGNEAHSFSLPCMDDLKLPQRLSPLEPFRSAAKHQPFLNNLTNHSEEIQPQPSLHGRPWLAENAESLQFPLSSITHRENKNASLPQNTKRSCWSKRRAKPWLNPHSGGTWAESSTVKEVEEGRPISAGLAEVKSDHRKVKESLKSTQGDTKGDAAHKSKKRKCTSHPQNVAGSLLAYKDVKVSDGMKNQINLNICSVSLSRNNVLARKESKMAISSSNTPNIFLGKSSTITERRREKTSKQQISNSLPKDEMGEEIKRSCKKRRRNRSEVEGIPLKKSISAERTGKAEADDNNDIIPVERKETPKGPTMDTLKEFQKLIRRQHPKTRKSEESQDKETNETTIDVKHEVKTCGNRCEESITDTEMNIDIPQPHNMDSHGIEESHVIFNVTVDKNHNHIFDKLTAEHSKSQRDDRTSSTIEQTSLFGEKCCPVFSFDVLEEAKLAKLAAEREKPLKNPDEAQKACDAAVSNPTQQTTIEDKGSSHCNTHTVPQGDKMPLDHSLNPQTPERTGPPLSDSVGFIKSSGCDQGEEEEVEVDVLLYSPDKVPQFIKCENGLDNTSTTPEEEEEEDMNEIDVTGD